MLVSNSAGTACRLQYYKQHSGNNRDTSVCAAQGLRDPQRTCNFNCNLSWNFLTRASGTITWLHGGAIAAVTSTLSVVDSKIDANTLLASTVSQGGGIYTISSTAKIRNCAVVGNTPDTWAVIPLGTGLYVASGTAAVESCTFLNNMGSGIYVADINACVSVSNSIVWANCLDFAGPATMAIGYCNIGNMPTNYDVGPGCFTANPVFERGLFLATNSSVR